MIPALRGRNSARAKTPSPLTRSSCQLGKVRHMKIIISCRTGQTVLHSGSIQRAVPLKQTNKITCAVHRRKLAHKPIVGVAGLSAILPSSIYLSVRLFHLVFLLNDYYSLHSVSLSSSSFFPWSTHTHTHSLFPTFRAVITPELDSFDQPEPNFFFIELLFFTVCVCASITLL